MKHRSVKMRMEERVNFSSSSTGVECILWFSHGVTNRSNKYSAPFISHELVALGMRDFMWICYAYNVLLLISVSPKSVGMSFDMCA